MYLLLLVISLSLSRSLDTWTSQVSSSFPVTWYLEPNERQPSLRIPDGPIIRWLIFFLVNCVPASHFVLLQPPHEQQCPAVPAGKLVKDAWSLEIHHYRWPSPTLENSKYSTLSMIMGWSFHRTPDVELLSITSTSGSLQSHPQGMFSLPFLSPLLAAHQPLQFPLFLQIISYHPSKVCFCFGILAPENLLYFLAS